MRSSGIRKGVMGCTAPGACLVVFASCAFVKSDGNANPAEDSIAADVVAKTEVETTGFLYKKIPFDRVSARTGEGQTVTMGGQTIALHGVELKVGDQLRAATLQNFELKSVKIEKKTGRVRILSVVPAVQTPTCEQQTHYLSEKSGDLSKHVEFVTISLDTPEVQKKFATDAGIENVTFLSDSAEAAFGRAHGLLIEEPHMLTRAVMVVDAKNVVRYLQVVPDIAHMPDMDAVFMFAQLLIPDDPK